MCTGFTHDTHQYFMKASPVDKVFFGIYAEIDLLEVYLCPGGVVALNIHQILPSAIPKSINI